MPRTTNPDVLDLKHLRELESDRGYSYLMDWIKRQRERWQLELETCEPQKFQGLQGAIKALRLVEQGRELCISVLTHDLATRRIPEEK